MANETEGIPQLKLEAAIGFNGHIPFGLWVHPNQEHLIYPLGSTVILKRITDGKQEFLLGHTNNVSCISVSKSGSFIASGQVNHMGFTAPVIIWNYEQRTIHAQLDLHKAKVEAVAFSPNDKYLVSLGGQDDGRMVVWNIETKQSICGSPVSTSESSHCFTVQYSNTNDNIFVSVGSGVQVWELDLANRKILPMACYTGKIRRIVKCVQISEDDELMFCGTTSGDILKIYLKTAMLNHCGPVKTRFNKGVSVLKILKSGDLLVGSGSGTLALCAKSNFKTLQKLQLENGVTSITGKDEGPFFIGMETAQMHHFSLKNFQTELISTSHSSAVNDVVIPHQISELFATCSEEEIRLWHVKKPKEVLLITVPKTTCNSLHIMADGHTIISGWNDGKIRVFGPQTGRLVHLIDNAHRMGVTAIAGTSDSRRIISGGGEGQVHVWELVPSHGHRLLQIMKKHKATVSCIRIKSNDEECVTAGCDGTCVIWDLVQFVSVRMIIAHSLFRTVCYHPEEHQIITSGTDRKVAYWEVCEGDAIRELVGSQSGTINAMHITQDGRHFVTGGDDKLLKVWDFMGGEVTHVGVAHGGSITSIKICCNNRLLVSTSADGGIMRWAFPHPPAI